jgi:hypothetical protein
MASPSPREILCQSAQAVMAARLRLDESILPAKITVGR